MSIYSARTNIDRDEALLRRMHSTLGGSTMPCRRSKDHPVLLRRMAKPGRPSSGSVPFTQPCCPRCMVLRGGTETLLSESPFFVSGTQFQSSKASAF
ncbi:putative ATP-dependent RNA helicase YTHDC2 [Anopheles sinensis]|uniref:Putative ATP-dependent RNA helicase YTHDC2 n=1 Tax=Anopheles sinensis TaxID=74873 RepID=A0A084W0R8_ANOSI|nr:putative ATP-dependent RNA helicase YTHDC2 [Anopheles sinensis]